MQSPTSKRQGRSVSRRDVLRLGALGLSLADWTALRGRAAFAENAISAARRAKSCIVLFAWGGMSHLDTWDMKPEASSDTRSGFRPIQTRTPGLQFCEHLPSLANHSERMAIVRSVHHRAPAHRAAAYWNLTGHEPPRLAGNWPATRSDWPSLGSIVWEAAARQAGPALPAGGMLPGAFALPYPIFDGGHGNGQHGGFLGLARDPAIVRPKEGRPYDGPSPDYGNVDLSFIEGIDRSRLVSRRGLLESLNTRRPQIYEAAAQAEQCQRQAFDMLLDDKVRAAFDLEREPDDLRARYGMHICGQSALLARKLTEAGVPLVTVYCGAGDLNGSVGANWDTHGGGFARLKDQMLPPLDQASAALLDDLTARNLLDQTLVVWLTEFGRTPRVDGSGGRDHYPNVYSVAFAGGGIRGGQVYGSSNSIGAEPKDSPCGPADLHATIFHALGIDPEFTFFDRDQRPLRACDGKPLPLFG